MKEPVMAVQTVKPPGTWRIVFDKGNEVCQ